MSLRRFILLTLTSLSTLGGIALAQCNSNDQGAPCFANNPDILNGRQSLLQDDDIVVNGTFATGFVNGAVSLTANSQITQSTETLMSAATPQSPTSNAINVRGRLFNLNHDLVVSAIGSPSNGVPGNGNAFVESNDNLTVPITMNVFLNARSLYGVSGRFLGNGFDQMVFAAAEFNAPLMQVALQTLAAVDPQNESAGLKAGVRSAPINNASNVYAMASGVFNDSQLGQPPAPAKIALLSGGPALGQGLALTFFAVDAN